MDPTNQRNTLTRSKCFLRIRKAKERFFRLRYLQNVENSKRKHSLSSKNQHIRTTRPSKRKPKTIQNKGPNPELFSSLHKGKGPNQTKITIIWPIIGLARSFTLRFH